MYKGTEVRERIVFQGGEVNKWEKQEDLEPPSPLGTLTEQ